MTRIPGCSTNNSVAVMLDSDQPSSSAPSSGTNSLLTPAVPVTTASTFTLSQQDLTQALSQALGDSLPQILVALQSHSTSSGSATRFLAGNLVLSATSIPSTSIASSPPLSFPSGSSTGNVFVPSFVSTYCTLGNSALSSSTQRLTSSFSLGFSFPSTAVLWATSSLHGPFVVGPGYSPIPEKLVTKIRTGQFIDLADLLAENLKGRETEPQTYLDGRLLVTSSKNRIQEITDIVTWIEAFTVYLWILCSAHPSRWQDMTQCKLLILKTSRQFPGKAWLHYDIAFCKDAAVSGLVDWSLMNLDLYNFHTRATLLQASLSSDVPSSASRMLASSTNICRSWNDGTCRWPFGQCRYRCSKIWSLLLGLLQSMRKNFSMNCTSILIKPRGIM